MTLQPRVSPARLLSRAPLRLALLHASMLVAPALLAAPGVALAQGLAPNAAPQGGLVVGGAASIGQTTATTTINQSTNRAVIDWRSFDVGRDHTVQFQQPSAASMTLNRVTGPNPSVIAGHITANGGIALVNQSGVVFTGGAQVTAQSVIVSTNDIANAGFMRGGAMVFDQPGKPGARIENQGTITARQAGLAALVAPQVANSGLITAKLGTVVLAGATQQVIDLNGDGLVSFAIGAAVRTPPTDGGALVSNTGTVRANGGTVLMTAAAADGVVQNLVRAGGTISAATDAATGRTGTVLLSGTGGSIIVEGNVAATGDAPGTKGGSVTVAADRVLVAGTARIDVSGRAGGGRIAVGTDGTAAGRQTVAARTGIAAGAVLRADATESGHGGQVVVNSHQATVQAGTITARGGPQGGDGGVVEVSSGGGLQLTGQIDVSAAAGALGQVIIDPADLTIVADGDSRINVDGADLADLILASGDPPPPAFLAAGVVGGITGNLTLQATNSITVSAGINKPTGGLEFDSGNLLTINAPVTLGAGDLILNALTIVLNSPVQVSASNQVRFDNTTGLTGGSVTESGAGAIIAGELQAYGYPPVFDTLTLNGPNQVGRLGQIYVNNTLQFNNTQSLLIDGYVQGNGGVSIDVRGGDLALTGGISSNGAVQMRASGNVDLQFAGEGTSSVRGSSIFLAAAFDFTAGAVNLTNPGSITLLSSLYAQTDGGYGPVTLQAGTGGITQVVDSGSNIQAGTLMVLSGGDVSLTSAQATTQDNPYAFYGSNAIMALGPSRVVGNFTLDTYNLNNFGTFDPGQDVMLNGAITVSGSLNLRGEQAGFAQQAGSVLSAAQLNATAVDSGGLTFGGDNRLVDLGTLAGNGITVRNAADLGVSGPVASLSGLTVSVVGGNLTVSGAVSSTDAPLVLQASGNVAIAAGGLVTASGSSTTAEITLSAATPDGGFDISQPGSVTLAGTFSTLRGVSINAGTGGITQSGGQIRAGLLTLQSGGQALLNGAGAGTPNTITQLRDVTAAGDFALDTGATDLVVGGVVTAANILLRTTGTLDLSLGCPQTAFSCDFPTRGQLDAGVGTVSLQVGGLVFEDPGNTVTGGVVEIAPAVAANLLVGGTAGSAQTGALSVNQDALGGIIAGTLRLGATTPGGTTANSVQFIAPSRIAGGLDGRSLGDVTQTGGSALTVLDALSGVAGGAIVLTEAGNNFGTVGDLSSVGNLSLTVTGAMTLTGLLTAPGQVATLISDTDITETGSGQIVAGTLLLQSGRNIVLAGANQVGQLGESSANNNFTFNDDVALTIAAGTTISAGNALSLTTTDSLTVDGQLTGASVVLGAGTGIFVSGFGGITTPQLSAQSTAGNIIIGGSNLVDALVSIQTPGRFAMENSAALLTIGAGDVVRADGGISLNPIQGGLAVNGTLLAAGATVNIVATSITEGANGSIQAGTLTVLALDSELLLIGPNRVNILGTSSANGDFTLNNEIGLTVAAGGTVTANGTLSLSAFGVLSIAGELHGSSVVLNGTQGIGGSGVIVTPLLVANSIAGDVSLDGANRVDQLGNSAANGNFTLNDAVALTVPAGVTVSGGLSLSLITNDTLTLAGQLNSAHVTLAATNGITEIGAGSISAGQLAVSSTTGDIILGGANVVAVLNSVSTPGIFVFNNIANALEVPAGHLISAGGGITLTLAGALALDGILLADGATVDISAASVTEGADGSIQSGLLVARATNGDLLLGGPNRVDQLGALSATGNLAFNSEFAVTVVPGETILAGGGLSLSSAQGLTVDGPLSATSVTLAGATGITQTGRGTITTPLLSASSSAGDIVLDGTNQVDALGNVSTPGRFVLADTASLLTIGSGQVVSAGGGITLQLSGALAVDGTLLASGATVDISATGITEGAGGKIQADLLTMRASDGDIVLGGPNAVARLGDSNTPGDFTFHNTVALNVPGEAVVQAGGSILITGDSDIVIDGHVEGGAVTLRAAGLLQINGFSAVAQGGPLTLTGARVVTTGLIASGSDILIDAGSASLGGQATGRTLSVTSPDIAFNGLNARGMQVRLFLGNIGTATGTLDAAGLLLAGGSGATLFGTLAGVSGEAAAARGRRADAEGGLYPPPPPDADLFTMNGCPIAVGVCRPLLVAPPTVATAPSVILAIMNPRRFSELLTDTALGLPTPTNFYLRAQPIRDPEDDVDLAPPNIRAENF